MSRSVVWAISHEQVERIIKLMEKINENLDRIADEIDALEARMRGGK